MTDLFRHRATAAWAALVCATCLPLALGATHGAHAAVATALVVAFVKVRYIGLDFMELRSANSILRGLFHTWVIAVGTTVLALYLSA